jgi:hypothetical protein
MRRPWRRWILTTVVILIIVAATTIGIYGAYRAGSTGG